jgi:hypothetical protein
MLVQYANLLRGAASLVKNTSFSTVISSASYQQQRLASHAENTNVFLKEVYSKKQFHDDTNC